MSWVMMISVMMTHELAYKVNLMNYWYFIVETRAVQCRVAQYSNMIEWRSRTG